ncbi:hypothetical protein ZIOFF_027558 [Zingiber officinale]|uniref:Uncharacterized protein n=1 Tax=Zingiber officinale TaxID=94328 RepID=A0A8J5GQL1_ZINOF|nr:hypothetical protein ZIOFF_027558 [Zingiber officinale]
MKRVIKAEFARKQRRRAISEVFHLPPLIIAGAPSTTLGFRDFPSLSTPSSSDVPSSSPVHRNLETKQRNACDLATSSKTLRLPPELPLSPLKGVSARELDCQLPSCCKICFPMWTMSPHCYGNGIIPFRQLSWKKLKQMRMHLTKLSSIMQERNQKMLSSGKGVVNVHKLLIRHMH